MRNVCIIRELKIFIEEQFVFENFQPMLTPEYF